MADIINAWDKGVSKVGKALGLKGVRQAKFKKKCNELPYNIAKDMVEKLLTCAAAGVSTWAAKKVYNGVKSLSHKVTGKESKKDDDTKDFLEVPLEASQGVSEEELEKLVAERVQAIMATWRSEQPENEQPEPEQPENEQPEPEQPENEQPEPEQPEPKKPASVGGNKGKSGKGKGGQQKPEEDQK